MPGMDIRQRTKPIIDQLNRDIAELTRQRDALLKVVTPSVSAKKPTTSTARSEAQRKRWAETKRKQRAAAKKGTK